MPFTKEQETELARLKAHFPFRICGMARKPGTDTVEFYARYTMATFNRLARRGWEVVVIRPS